MTLSPSEQLLYTTLKIYTEDYSGRTFSTGTGFIVNLYRNDNESLPVLITNKHVVKDGYSYFIVFSQHENGMPVDDRHITIRFKSTDLYWRMHPDDNVDLCFIPIASLLSQAESNGGKPFIKTIGIEFIPTADRWAELDAIENIIMIGYPNGLWDELNNKPIARRGITATHPSRNYNGKEEFVIDCACFGGSSGSPVFILERGIFSEKTGGISNGDRALLLGVLYAGPQMKVTGEIETVLIPTSFGIQPTFQTLINLGFVIKSTKILYLIQLFPEDVRKKITLENEINYPSKNKASKTIL